MKLKMIYILAVLGVGFMILSRIVGDMGNLLGFIFSNIFLLLFGIAAVMSVIILGKNGSRRDVKFTIGALIFACLLLFVGGKNLVSAAKDVIEGPKEIYLNTCSVSKNVSLRRIFQSYYLEGVDSTGEEKRFPIDKYTYEKYENNREFSIQIYGWEQSEIIKELY